MSLPASVLIESADDPRIADYVDVKEAELVKARGLFLAEGPEVVRTLARSRFAVRSLFLLEKRLAAMADVIEALPAGVPVYVASAPVMDRVVGYPIHRGVLAAGERGTPEVDLARAETLFVLEAVSNHDNVGGIFRNALAFGVDAVLLDPRAADPLYRKAIRVSMGATLLVPFGPIRDLTGFTRVALTPSADAQPIDRVTWPERVAFFLGTEGPGLDAATLDACELRVRIPMAPRIDSLNVATASGIAAFSRYAARR